MPNPCAKIWLWNKFQTAKLVTAKLFSLTTNKIFIWDKTAKNQRKSAKINSFILWNVRGRSKTRKNKLTRKFIPWWISSINPAFPIKPNSHKTWLLICFRITKNRNRNLSSYTSYRSLQTWNRCNQKSKEIKGLSARNYSSYHSSFLPTDTS